ncbi:MAG: carbohydrate ABC transporter permease [Bacteroidetes bacterium]|nr:carbohydrate ABC transporter permease [Bacteroidota bacterium]
MRHTYYQKNWATKTFDVLNLLLMLALIFIMLYPFINQIALSFNDGNDALRGGIYFFPRKFSLNAYELLFSHPKLLRGAGISLLRVVVGTITCLFTTGLLGYIVTIRSFSGRKFLRILFIFTMYLSGGLIPFYLLIVGLGLTNTFTVYWLPTLINTYYMLLMASYMQNLPSSLAESARIDGCFEIGIYIRIIIPIATPVFAAIAVFVTVQHWNSWFDVLIYNPSGTWDTLQIYLRRLLLEVEAISQIKDQQLALSKLRNVSPITYRAATSIIVIVPIVMVYPFLQKFFISGITMGAVKE